MYTRHGGFLGAVDRFDPSFFRISPREARSMDPQQRLLLEVAWEALEDAGIAANRSRSNATGVFIGLTTNDYARLLMQSGDGRDLDAYFFSGNPANAAAGRLAYTFGWEGPAVAIDTACSSSLVSVHQACASLRSGECAVALAGGVNLVLIPENTVAVCRTRALSPDGLCKTFDAGADGFVRSEGCGLVVLKRLSDAVTAGDRVRAVIRGSAVNQDGASSGFTVPNGNAQQRVIRLALGAIPPSDIDYLEVHGTGTPLGDPIEVGAAAAVLGQDREPSRPLYIGSVKTNIGHCEAAAGVAALIKTVLALQHAEIPPHLHVHEPNPLIPWDTLPVRVPVSRTPWPQSERPRLAGVSAFGASGTNAHVVLEEAPSVPSVEQGTDRTRHLLVLSAKTRDALHELIVRYRDQLASNDDANLGDICYSAAVGRAHHEHRVAVVAASTPEAAVKLAALATAYASAPAPAPAGDDAAPRAPRIAFLFTGQGAQYCGMGRTLYDTNPTFRQAIDQCAAIVDPRLDAPLQDLLFAAGQPLDATQNTQPAIFALEYALTVLLESWGIRPAIVMGHSVGEYPAAVAAGVFSCEDGLRLVAERARLMGSLPVDGAMAAVASDEASVSEALQRVTPALSIAAVNGPRSVVVSGDSAAVGDLCNNLTTAGVRTAPLTVSHAFHSDLMEPMLDRFEEAAHRVPCSAPSVPLVSNVTGGLMAGAPDSAYWRHHCRDAVRFADGVETLAQEGCDSLVEIGPRPTLVRLAAQRQGEGGFLGLATLSPGEDDWQGLLEMLGQLYVRGVNPDWVGLDGPYVRRRVALPTYPFQRKSYWVPEHKAPMQQIDHQRSEPAHAAPRRRESVLATLRSHVATLIQASESEINVHLPFLEMGADSLVMVDAIGIVEKEFGIKLTIRRFFEDLSTIDALARHIDATLPSVTDAEAETSAATIAADAGADVGPEAHLHARASSASDATSLERILNEQTKTLTQFLAQQGEAIRLALGRPAPGSIVAPVRAAVPARVITRPTDSPVPAPPPWGNPAEIRARGLTETQHRHLELLIGRYTARTAQSKQRTQQYRSVLADSRATVGFRLSTKEMLYPIWGARSDGSRMWDIDGNDYIDYTMGFGVHLFGHKPPFVQQAIQEDFDRAVELGARSPLAGEVASLFTELTGLDRVALCNSGTEAVMAAIRLARAGTGRDKIAIFTNAYHGHSDTTLVRAQRTDGQLLSVPMAPGVPAAVSGDVLVLDYGTDESLEIIRTRGHELAAVMVEPVQSRHLTLQPRAFLHELRAITQEVGAALIFDEMITGFRAAPGGAQEYFGVKADIATYGKTVGGGLPIGLVAGSSAFMDGVDGGMWQYGDGSFPSEDRTAFGGTFCQHPLSMAAAVAVLRQLKNDGPGLQHRLNQRTNRLVAALNAHFVAEELPIEATNFSSLFRFEFSRNLDLLFYHMLEKGIYIWEWRSCFLSTAHSDADIQRFVDVVQESLDDLRQAGFVGKPSGTRAGTPTRAPLSDAQQQLALLLNIENTSSLAYNIGATFELRGALDPDRLRLALQGVVDRHSALRSTLAPDGTYQCIHKTAPVSLSVTDLSITPAPVRDQALDRWRGEISRQPIDLVRGPTFRPQLARLDVDRHVLVLTAHHLFADGLTMGLVMRELATGYNEQGGGAKERSARPMQFHEYVALCEEHRDSPAMKAHEAFWIEQFSDGVPQLDLPLDRVRPPMKTYAGGRVTRHIDGEALLAVKRVSRELNCTLNMTLLTGFALLLHRYAGQDDIVLGTSVTGRPFPGSMEVAGYCTHLVPMRSLLDGEQSFADLLATTKRRLLDVLDHQDLPFAQLLRALPAPRTTGAFPLISAVFNLEPVSDLPAFQGLTARLLPQPVSFTPFDLFVNVTDAGDSLVVDADFNADLFDLATVERMMSSYDSLLRAAVEAPSTLAVELPLLTPAERHRIVVEWNDTATTYPDQSPAHILFEQWATKTPEAVALQFEGQDVTYAALNARANQLARWLRSRGVRPDTLVAICCERSVELVTAILGVLKAGGAYVPIDPEYPKDRVALMVKDSGAAIVLTQAKWDERSPSDGAERFRLDADWGRIESRSTNNPRYDVTGDQLAYVIYTSGSTGRPKGAMNTHRALTNRLLWMQEAYDLTLHDRVVQKTPYTFDVSVWEFLWPLIAGTRLVVARPGGHRDTRYLVDLIESAHITTIHFVPSMLQAFLEEPDLDRCRSLRRVICSGEALSPELLRRSGAALEAPLHNLYGPTEAAIDVTAWACDPAEAGSVLPIGRPIANTQIYLLDPRGEPVPVGVTGELFIGGVGVGRGYLNQPDLTRERFVQDPFSPEADARMYQTGDLARFRPDGQIEYLGRVDHQVKVRGFRIELGEIEARLLECPGVTGAVVVADDTAAGDKRLVAYVAASDRGDTFTGALRTHLAQKLPDYMVPSAFVALDAIPLLPSGKVDRGQLPEIVITGVHVTPKPGIEADIAAIWEDVLQQAPIGATDDFFALGGNSLSAGQVVSRIGYRLDARVGIKDIFLHATVRSLASEIRRGSGQNLPAITPLAPQPDYELSHAERRFWIQDQLADPNKGNSHPARFLIEGPLDVDALRLAFKVLVSRHEILRTVFVEVKDEPRQQIRSVDDTNFDLIVIDLSESSDVESSLRHIERREASTRMDLSVGPLFRAQLVRLADDRHMCVCSMHHTVTDGWSVGVLLNEVTALYDAFVFGQQDPLPPLAIQYKDYAAWHNQIANGPESEPTRDYWRTKLGGAVPALALPTDFTRTGHRYQRAERRFTVDADTIERLESTARQEGATLFMAMLSCIKVLLYRHTAQEDLCVGTPVAGRIHHDLESQIGPYLNVLALRDTVVGDDTLASVLDAVRQTTLDAYANQFYPFDRVVDDLRLKRDPTRNPLFDVGFTLQNQHEVQGRDRSRHIVITDLMRHDESFEDPEAATDLWFVARRDDQNVAVQVVYNGALFRPDTIDTLSRDLQDILLAMATTPDGRVKAVALGAIHNPPVGRKITIDLGL
jgi:amino acid adenylation domain-containing protein